MDNTVFVAREPELTKLSQFLDATLAGKGQVCFLSGEAGSGKTTLLTEFTRRSQDLNKELVAALGRCDAQTGVGDAYLPFREVLAQLVGDVESQPTKSNLSQENNNRLIKLLSISGQVLVEVVPELIGSFIPFGKVITMFATQTAKKVGWIEKLEKLARKPKPEHEAVLLSADQDQIFEQYTRFLIKLSEKRPILLILDDLQWADSSSMALLFRLGRRISESRIFLLCTYRPEEVAQGRNGERHPLEKVLTEFKRYFGEIEINLDREGAVERRHFVDALIDSEPNLLGEDFRLALYNHTDGHALFTVELLRALQERGDLKKDAMGRWELGPELDWKALPARVEGVIEERIGRLEEKLCSALKAASVEGEDFTAEVVAKVRTLDTRELTRRLSEEVQKEHHLVQAQGVKRLENERLSLYRFEHTLFQQYLYNGLDPVERATLHEDVGNVIEALYGDQAAEMAPQLARHFEEAGLSSKAAHYMQLAGEQAAARFANQEAVGFYCRALVLISEKEASGRYRLLIDREKVYDLLGQREAQRQDLEALITLAQTLGVEHQAETAVRQADFLNVTCDYPGAIMVARSAIDLALSIENKAIEAGARVALGLAYFNSDRFSDAKLELEKAREQAHTAGLLHLESLSWRILGSNQRFLDPVGAETAFENALQLSRQLGEQRDEADALSSLALMVDINGKRAQAVANYEMSLEISHKIGYRSGEITPLKRLGQIHCDNGEFDLAIEKCENALLLSKENEQWDQQGSILAQLSDISFYQGFYSRGIAYSSQSLTIYQNIGNRWGESGSLVTLGMIYKELGDFKTALAKFGLALKISRDIGQKRVEAWALGNQAESLFSEGDLQGAWDNYELAVKIAREINSAEAEASVFFGEGEILEFQRRFVDSIEAYRKAYDLLTNTADSTWLVDVKAGLAHTFLSMGEPQKALFELVYVLGFIETRGSLKGNFSPLKIYLICYQVLQANKDPRAKDLLRAGYIMLRERAAGIDDEALKYSFLENVPWNREIARLWKSVV